MPVAIRTARPQDIDQLLTQFDQAFVFGRGRRISLARRFPAVYGEGNAENLFIAEEDGEILSGLACVCFDWRCTGGGWQGAMIGGVHTQPQRRGEGLANRLLARVADKLRADGVDFAVLWTDQAAFYARLGWIPADRGVLGALVEAPMEMDAGGGKVSRLPAHAADSVLIERVERIRAAEASCLMPRRPEDYARLPLPAEAVDLLLCREGGEAVAYALVGDGGGTAILYEMGGDPCGFPALWAEVRGACDHVLVNDRRDSPSQSWLEEHAGLAWRDKPLAMWLPLSGRVDVAEFARWYIPYLDRI